MAVLLTLVLLAVAIAAIGTPLFGRARTHDPVQDRKAELQSAREAKYREIRDAELDYRTGKLSQGDYEAVDAALRVEALDILDSLQEIEEPRLS